MSGFSLLVIAVALLRLIFLCLPWFQQYITAEVSERLNTDLSFQSVEAQWQGGMPRLSIRGLELQGKEAIKPGFTIDRFEMELNLRNTLLHRKLVFNDLQINGVAINLVQDDGARWYLQGIEDIAGSSVGGPKKKSNSPFDWINYQQRVDIRDINLNMKKKEGESSLVWKHLTLSDAEGLKSLTGRLESEDGYVELNGQGYGTRPSDSQWSLTLKAENLDLAEFCILWSGCYNRIGTSLTQIDTRIEYRDGYWQVQGEAGIPYMAYQDVYGKWKTFSGHTNLFLEAQIGQQWQLWLNDFSIHNGSRGDDALYWNKNWYLKGNIGREYSMTVAAEILELDKLKQWILDTDFMPGNIVELITSLNPKGQLDNIAVQFFPGREIFDFDLSANLNNVSVDNWDGAPLAANVNGTLRTGLLNGYFDLDTENFKLGFPELFRENWVYHSAKARIYWDIVDDYYILKSDDIAMTAAEGNLRGKLRLDIPLSDSSAPMDMALTVGITEGDARQTPKYLPVYLPIDEGLVEWLDTAIRKADINSGGFLWNGAIVGSKRSEDSRWGLFFDVRNGKLDYGMGDWPLLEDLSARVFVNDDRVEVVGNEAKSAGATLKNFSAHVPLNDDDLVVNVHGRAFADGKAVRYFLTETPVDEYLEGEARSWKLEGEASAGLRLELPIENMDDFTFSLDASVKDFLFAIPESDISVEHLRGRLSFSTEEGLNSRALYGSFLGRPAEYSIQTVMSGSELMYTDISWRSRISVPRLQHWLGLDWLSLLEGETDYEGQLRLTPNALDLKIISDLKGMEIEFPEPLAKLPDSTLPFNLRLLSNEKSSGYFNLTASLGELGQTSIRLTPEFNMDSAAILLGSKGDIQPVSSNQVVVSGHLPELDVEVWQNRFAGQPGRDNEIALARQLQIDNVQIDRVKYSDYQWQDMKVSLSGDDDAITLAVDSENLAGNLVIPVKQDKRYHLEMERLNLPEEPDGGGDMQYDALSEVNPALLPDIDVVIKSLKVGDQSMGAVSLSLEQTDNGLKIDNLLTSLAGMKLTGFADWVYTGNEHHSWFQGKLEGGSLGDFNKAMGLPEMVVSEKSLMDINLNWYGSPLNKSFSTMKGGIDIRLEKGKIIDGGPGSGALRLFGVLNVDTLRRRMFLDFSDLYSSGISFDELTGVVRFNQGVVTFDKPVVIKGPSSTIRLNGSADANKEELDLTMSVTLPVTSNLPILSVLLGTAPPLAGVIFIADKLVGDQVNELASIHYTIKGSFDEPVIGLDENFARRARNQKSSGNNK